MLNFELKLQSGYNEYDELVYFTHCYEFEEECCINDYTVTKKVKSNKLGEELYQRQINHLRNSNLYNITGKIFLTNGYQSVSCYLKQPIKLEY